MQGINVGTFQRRKVQALSITNVNTYFASSPALFQLAAYTAPPAVSHSFIHNFTVEKKCLTIVKPCSNFPIVLFVILFVLNISTEHWASTHPGSVFSPPVDGLLLMFLSRRQLFLFGTKTENRTARKKH